MFSSAPVGRSLFENDPMNSKSRRYSLFMFCRWSGISLGGRPGERVDPLKNLRMDRWSWASSFFARSRSSCDRDEFAARTIRSPTHG
jgi:hypothetical protein